MKQEGFNALVFGSTGAIGTELIISLLRSPQWSKVHCIVRREVEEWKTFKGYDKLVIEKFAELDDFFKQPNNNYQHINAMFCCLGIEIKNGEEMFTKIDKTFPLMAADIAASNSMFVAM